MSVARVASRAQLGLSAPRVDVEVHLGSGLPQFSIVGFPATAVKESKDRVRAALANCRLRMARGPHHRESLAGGPAEGRLRYDLPIALGILLASAQSCDAQRLEGCGVLRRARTRGRAQADPRRAARGGACRRAGMRMVVPAGNFAEATHRRADRGAWRARVCSRCARCSGVQSGDTSVCRRG